MRVKNITEHSDDTYFGTCIFPHSQTTHPHLSQQNLAACVRNELSMACRHSQTQAGLIRPVLKFVGEQLLCQIVIGFVAVFKQIVGQHREFA